MKRFIFLSLAGLFVTTLVVAQDKPDKPRDKSEEAVVGIDKSKIFTVTDRIRFNEGAVATRHGILLTNFGSSELNPLGKQGKGYVISLDRHGVNVSIPADGTLDAPKGMAVVRDEYLFIADVGRVVVYNLKKMKEKDGGVVIPLPKEDVYVNDAVALGDLLLVSVTNTGRIYAIDVKDCENLHRVTPRVAATIPGANGLAVSQDGVLYIASYNPNNRATQENVIYAVDMTEPGAEPVNILAQRAGMYDGLAVSGDGTKLYFTNWKGVSGKAEVGYVDLTQGKDYAVTLLDLGMELQGPADIAMADGYLYIPDLPANVLYIVEL